MQNLRKITLHNAVTIQGARLFCPVCEVEAYTPLRSALAAFLWLHPRRCVPAVAA